MSSTGSLIQPTISNVFCQTNEDALMIVELILQRQLFTVQRRAQDRERASAVQSGNVFVFEHTDTGIKRWTDGVHWSPSRILGNFLLYRELSRPFPPGQKKRAQRKSTTKSRRGPNTELEDPHHQFHPMGIPDPGRAGPLGDSDRSLVGSLIDSYDFKTNGLVKKTISIQDENNRQFHLISYYIPQDVLDNRLTRPTDIPAYGHIRPRTTLFISSSLRQPPSDVSRRPSFIDEGGADAILDGQTDEDDETSGSPSKIGPYGRHEAHHPHAFLPSSFPGGPSDYNYMSSQVGYFPPTGSPHGFPGDLGPQGDPMKVEDYDMAHGSHNPRYHPAYTQPYTTGMSAAAVSAPLSLPAQTETITSQSWSGSPYSGFQSSPLNTNALSGSAPYRTTYSTVGGGHYDRPMVPSPAASNYSSASSTAWTQPLYGTHSPQPNASLGQAPVQDRSRFPQDGSFVGWTSSPQPAPGSRAGTVSEEDVLQHYPPQWTSQ
ncbi:hypothetical protein DRE_06269 [Drechslerella stenobrocha 248]|uniref:Gti1/Pac2 family protein n=1 Tax=Drechslerella stenobrocha 248 TaxID=1043628 RepID=W7I811_9PEZI|nr:hypothetical protein DRE_06269 [Drechslerella stenobrocha 248]